MNINVYILFLIKNPFIHSLKNIFPSAKINPFTSSGLFYHNSLDQSFSSIITMFYRNIPVFTANNGDPDQTPCSAESDLGLHCLQITPLGVSRLKSVNY